MQRVRGTFKQMAGFVLAVMLLLSLSPAVFAEEAPQPLGLSGAMLVSDGLSVEAAVDSSAGTAVAEVAGTTQLLVLEGTFNEAVVQAADGQASAYDPATGLELALAPGENLYTVTLRGGDEERVYSLSVTCQADAAAPESTEPEGEALVGAEAEDGEEIELEAAAAAQKVGYLYLSKNLFSWADINNCVSSEIKGFTGTFEHATPTDLTPRTYTYETTMSTAWARPHLLLYAATDAAGYRTSLVKVNADKSETPVSWGRIAPLNDVPDPVYNNQNLFGVSAACISVPLDLEKGNNVYKLTYTGPSWMYVFNITLKLTANKGERVEPKDYVLGHDSLYLPKNYNGFIGFAPVPENATLPVEDILWESSDSSIASVSASGLVTASDTKEGTVTITAKHRTNTSWEPKTCTVTVGGQVSSVTMEETATLAVMGQTKFLYANVDPADRVPTWRSENSRVVKVVATGTDLPGKYYAEVQGVGAGTTKVWATAGSKSAANQVTVREFYLPQEEKLSIDDNYRSITTGGSAILVSSLYSSSDLAKMLKLRWTIVQGESLVTNIQSDSSNTYMKLTVGTTPGTVVVRHWSATHPNLWAEARIDIVSNLAGATDTDLAPARLETSTVTVNANGNAKAPFSVSRGATGLQYHFGAAGNTFSIVPVDEKVPKDVTAATAAKDLFEVAYASGSGDTLTIAYKGSTDEAYVKKLASSYRVGLQMKVGGTGQTVRFAGALTIKVDKKLPSTKVKDGVFNTFYDGNYRSVDVAGLTLSSLMPQDDKNVTAYKYFHLVGAGTTGTDIWPKPGTTKGSATMYFTAKFEEYGNREFTLPVKLKAHYTPPAVKLGATTLNMPISMSSYAVDGMAVTLKTKSAKDSLSGFEVKNVTVVPKSEAAALAGKGKNPYDQQDELYEVMNSGRVDFSSGEFRVTTKIGANGWRLAPQKTKLLLQVSFWKSDNKVYLPLTIKPVNIWKPTFKVSAKSLTLNKSVPGGDPATISVSSNLSYAQQPLYAYTLTKGGKILPPHKWPISVLQNGWNLNIAANGLAKNGDTYKLKAAAGGSSFTITVKIAKNDDITLTGTAKGSLDLATRGEATVNLKLSGYQGKLAKVKPGSLKVTDASKDRNPIDAIDNKLDVSLVSTGGTTLALALADDLYTDGSAYALPTGSYYISELTLLSETGEEIKLSKPVKFSVKASKPKTTATPAAATLYKEDRTAGTALLRLNTAAKAPIKSVKVAGALGGTFEAKYLDYGTNTVVLSFKDADAAKNAKGTKTVTLEVELYGSDNKKPVTTTVKVKVTAK